MTAARTTRKLHTVGSAISGMRRVDCVRMVEDDQPRFYVVGVGSEREIVLECSASLALIAQACGHQAEASKAGCFSRRQASGLFVLTLGGLQATAHQRRERVLHGLFPALVLFGACGGLAGMVIGGSPGS